jgi:septal ring factor EnvC (AmiA/AmiB activator)
MKGDAICVLDSKKEEKMSSSWQPLSAKQGKLDGSNQSAPQILHDIDNLRQGCRRLEIERDTLSKELAESRAENRSLRESAFLWISLYERQVERANKLAKLTKQ